MWPWKPKVNELDKAELRVLMVCTGNICRSPTAEAVLRKLAADRGLQAIIGVDSAGTHALSGSPPDVRSQSVATQRGYDLSTLRARQFLAQDFERFHHIVVMDSDNQRWLAAQGSPQSMHKVALLMSHPGRPDAAPDVPDPYYGSPEGFELVFDLIETACQGLIASLVAQPRQR